MLDSKSQHLHYEPEKNYPTNFDPESLFEGKLKPKQISYDNLQKAISSITSAIIEDNIKLNQCKSFLKQYGFNNESQELVIENATNMKRWKECKENKHDNPDLFRKLSIEKKKNPKKFEEYKLPSSWYNTTNDISVFVDVPMHLLMLGVVKAVMLSIGAWLRSINKNKYFKTAVAGMLIDIKSLNIEWCKILDYPSTDKTGGWVSENFSAMARICTWFYSMINFLFPEEEYNQPIQSTLEDKQIRPNTILQLVQSMSLMIKTVMTLNHTAHDADKLEALIRFFLINYDNVTTDQLTKNDSPPWITHYNMLCLLNLPEVLRTYGSMRNIWEGGMDGEAYVKKAKNKLKSGLVNQWQVWAIESLLKDELYSEWKDDAKESDLLGEYKMKIRQLCKIYGNYLQARKAYDSGKPFSCIQRQTSIWLLYRDSGNIIGKKVFVGSHSNQLNMIDYYQITLKKETRIFNHTEEQNDTTYTGVLFLPYLSKTGYPNKRDKNSSYCLLKSDWS
jgi:hypothetical protein